MSQLLQSARAALCLISLTMAGQASGSAQVIGINHFAHIVASLDKSFAFYKDLLQLDPEITPQPFGSGLL
jgi:hypothetical protein